MKNHVVHYVTFQYMKQNLRRTVTAFLGIVFMVLLMTCVFVGKDTGISYLEDVGEARDGKWHASIYDINSEELSEIESMEHVSDLAISKSMGMTAFNRSQNPEKPYLNIRAYSEKCFDWMNIELSEGRFPTGTNEIILSESVREDGSSIQIGDEISAEISYAEYHGNRRGRRIDVSFSGYYSQIWGICRDTEGFSLLHGK